MGKITLQEAKKIRLSKNFYLDEFIKSDTAQRKDIDNSMPDEYLQRIQDLVDNVLQPLRDIFGPIRILSGYRSVDLCLAIGSNEHSNHAYGFVADIEPIDRDVSLYDILSYINKKMEYKELIAEFFPDGWVHVAYQRDNNKRVLKLKDKDNDYTIVTFDYIKTKYKS